MLIATTGMPGSGKGAVLEFFRKKEIDSVVMRTVVEEKMKEDGIEVNNKNLREYATKLREDNEIDIVARLCVPIIKEMLKTRKNILIDGIRSYEEITCFKKEFGEDFILIAVEADFETRFERLKNRGETWDMHTKEELKWRDDKELSWGLGKSIESADYKIDNNGTKKELEKQLEEIFNKIY